MILRIEYLATIILSDFLCQYYCFANEQRYNTVFIATYKRVTRSKCKWLKYGRKRLALLLYMLAEVHNLFLTKSFCTYRQLYYKNVEIMGCNWLQIYRAVTDACNVLDTKSWNLGIFAAGKCFVTGPLLIHMSNGDVIDCNTFKGPTIMPPNFTYIDKFEVNAEILLIIEKDTVFQYLVGNDIFSVLNGKVIMITARGYPDFCTRWALHKLSVENFLDFYVLVDGDPYGIEIMLIYRYGCAEKNLVSYNLCCRHLKWLGIHPSDFSMIVAPKETMGKNDCDKIKSLLRRQNLKEEIRNELLILDRLKYKIKIDNISVHMFPRFINDYILNKINRQIIL